MRFKGFLLIHYKTNRFSSVIDGKNAQGVVVVEFDQAASQLRKFLLSKTYFKASAALGSLAARIDMIVGCGAFSNEIAMRVAGFVEP